MTAPSSQKSVRELAVGSAGWVTLDKWGVRLGSLVVFAVLGRLVSPADFGVITLATVYVMLLLVFVDSGFSKALVQREDLTDDHANAAFWISLGGSVVLAGVMVLVAPLIADASGSEQLGPVLRALSLALPLTALAGVPDALLSRSFAFRALAIRHLFATVVGSAVAVALAIAGAGVWALVAQTLSTAAVGVLVLWRVSLWRPSFSFSTEAARELWTFGVNVLGIDLIQFVMQQVDKLLVGLAFGTTQLGYYYVGSRIAQVMLDMLAAVIGTLALPTFSRMQGDPARVARVLGQLTFVAATVAFPAFALTAALAPEVLRLVFGDQWDASVPVMQALALSSALAAVAWFDKDVFLGSGKPRVAFNLAVGQTALGTALLVAALPFGIVAVALSRSAFRLLFWPIRLRTMRRHLEMPIRPYLRQFVAPGLASLLGAAVILLWQRSPLHVESDLVAVFGLGALGSATYLAALFALDRARVLQTLGVIRGGRAKAS